MTRPLPTSISLARGACAPTIALLLTVSLASTGCRSFSRQGPVPRAVATCQQLSQQGSNAMERGDWEQAETLLSKAVKECPANPEARRQYGEALWHRGARELAIAQFEAAREVGGDDAELGVRTGQMYLASGRIDAASQAAERALRIDGQSASAWALRGQIAITTGQVREGLADYQRSLGYSPGNREVQLQVAEAYRRLNQPEQALAALQTLIDLYSPGEEPQQALALQAAAFLALNRATEAADSLALALQRGPATPDLLCRLGEAELLAGHSASARTSAQQALALDPSHAASRALIERLELARRPTSLPGRY